MTLRQRRALWVILLLGFVLRLAWGVWARGGAPVAWYESGDQFSYYYYGSEIAQGRGYLSYISGQPTAYNPIGFPALLGALFFVVLHTPIPDNLYLAAVTMHIALSAATVWLVFIVGRAVAGVRVGLVGAAIFAVWPGVVFLVPTLLIEPTFTFLTTAAVAVGATADWSKGRPSWARLLTLGLVLGASVLVRPFSIWLVLGVLLAARAGGGSWKRAATSALVPLAVVVVMMVPWTLRNLDAMGALVPSSTNMGDTLCIDRFDGAAGGFHSADHEGCVDPSLSEVERNRGNTRKAISFVVNHPQREALQVVRRARFMLRDDHYGLTEVQNLGGEDPLSAEQVDDLSTAADAFWLVVLVASTVGSVLLVRRQVDPAALRVVATTALSLVIIPLLLWGNPRFHAPFMPFMAVTAGVSVVALLGRTPRWAPP